MSTILVIVVLVILFGGGGYFAHGRYGGAGLGGVLGLVPVVHLAFWRVSGTEHMADMPHG